MNTARAFLLALLLAPAGAVVGQQATFSVRTDAVRLDVSVMRGGQSVVGLRASDFEVLDGEVPQVVELVSYEHLPLDVAFVLDTSGSVHGERLRRLVEATNAVLDDLKQGDRAALVAFNHVVHLRIPLAEGFEQVRRALVSLKGAGLTSLFDATYASLALARAGGSDRSTTVILFSDGNDTSSWLTATAALDACRRADVSIYAVRASGETDTKYLDEITGATGGRMLRATDGNLRATFLTILEELKHRYLLSYYPKGADAKGWHAVTVRLKAGRAQVKARPGYYR
jgi:VWFA-related protein